MKGFMREKYEINVWSGMGSVNLMVTMHRFILFQSADNENFIARKIDLQL
jgi:hypothetical protein